jgi:hypothetical protein
MQTTTALTRTLAVTFTDRAYQLSHMRAPRGRGSWAFEVKHAGVELPLVWANGTYAEAKSTAKAQARAMQAAGLIPPGIRSVTLDAQP